MAKTTFASRIATLRLRAESEHKRSESNLATWIGSLYELLGIRRLSRVQISWCRHRIIAIRDKYPEDLRVLKMLDDLDVRVAEAQARCDKRIAKREEARAAEAAIPAKPRGRPRKDGTSSAPSPLSPPGISPISVWEEMLKQQKESDGTPK